MRQLLSAFVACCLLVTAAPRAGAQTQPATIEYDVKAAFLLNFARYVEWPAAARRGQAFGLCVFEPDPFGPRLEVAVAGETWQGAPITVKRLADGRDLRNCHLLYVPAAAMTRYASVRSELLKTPVLTVGEASDFVTRGGIIQLLVDQNRVKFSINQATADVVGLRISSRLLRLAREVLQKPAGLK